MKRLAPLLLVLAACGSDEGEPIDGTILINYGGATVIPTVGAAIPDEADPTRRLVIIGTRNISCETRIDSPLSRGTYLTFTIDGATGVHMPHVAVIRIDSNSSLINGAPGMVMIDGLADRVTGSVTFTTTDDEIGTIAADGTFDVIGC